MNRGTEWGDREAAALLALQRGVPLTSRPFAEVGAACGMDEDAVLELTQGLLASGVARRFGAVFDARRLGYRSALCSIRTSPERIQQTVAARVAAVRGVTHAYVRGWPDDLPLDSPGGPAGRVWPNFWFTLTERASAFDAELAGLRAACAPDDIEVRPALRRFKIDVVFDVRTRARDERVETRPDDPDNAVISGEPGPAEQAVIRLLGGNIRPRAQLFADPAASLGMSEEALLDLLRAWKGAGLLRRFGLIVRHHRMGFKANGMCCWPVSAGQIVAAGRRVAAFPEVTHCYERPPDNRFPFNLYAMIHTPTWQGTQDLFVRISREAGLDGGQLLLSLGEFKKTSMSFF